MPLASPRRSEQSPVIRFIIVLAKGRDTVPGAGWAHCRAYTTARRALGLRHRHIIHEFRLQNDVSHTVKRRDLQLDD